MTTSNGPNHTMFLSSQRQWPIDKLLGKASHHEMVPIREIDWPKEALVKGVQLHRFINANVEGVPQYLILAIGDRTVFTKAIHVREDLLDITWRQGWFAWDQL